MIKLGKSFLFLSPLQNVQVYLKLWDRVLKIKNVLTNLLEENLHQDKMKRFI